MNCKVTDNSFTDWLSGFFKFHNIDAEIERRCKILWESKQYDACITQATKVLEDRLRQIIGINDAFGVKLIDDIFKPDGGKIKVFEDNGEQDGFRLLLRGFFQLLKNPFSHRFIDPQPDQTIDYICTLNTMLSWINIAVTESLKQTGLIDHNSKIAACIAADVNMDNKVELVIASSIRDQGKYPGSITTVRIIERILPEIKQIILPDKIDTLSDDISIRVSDVNKDGVPEIIIEYSGGAHGHWMDVFRWDKSEYRNMSPDNKGFFSDAGIPFFRDTNQDGVDEIIVQIRDYDSNPQRLCYRTTYQWQGDRYREINKIKTQW